MIEGTSSGNVLMKIATVFVKEAGNQSQLNKISNGKSQATKATFMSAPSVSGFDYSNELTRKLTY
jgi:hypothetical protein